ncbi:MULTISPECIES: hypothetical protein [Anaerostipes]|uniref:Uncharacterized protein n=1 Tax=Anaerostipes butyraticus TaxID=645466 RepID=A0A916Q4M3_9FIRM|nr:MULTISPECIES: hypothetical protein [Anaerostipes]GFO84313.1 hypothetical protein ANBU17_06600 [Anaerostipes butyraticus]HJC83656.1 hypothetical protein [Candidatus Anaerostipes avicola]
MKKSRKKSFAYRPSDRVVSRISAVSSILGILGILGYIVLIFGSFQASGNGSVWYGLGGWAILVCAAAGMYCAVRSFEDTAAMAVWKIVGCVTNGIVLLFSLIIFILGLIA